MPENVFDPSMIMFNPLLLAISDGIVFIVDSFSIFRLYKSPISVIRTGSRAKKEKNG